jgi:hypothetical protein
MDETSVRGDAESKLAYCLRLRRTRIGGDLSVSCRSVINHGRLASSAAHIALLHRTPVIGSGAGGMGELLEGANQIVCRDWTDLPAMLEAALANKTQLAADGYRYAMQFDLKRFRASWLSLVEEMSIRRQTRSRVSGRRGVHVQAPGRHSVPQRVRSPVEFGGTMPLWLPPCGR